jgi:malate/lactate dehydrogenase
MEAGIGSALARIIGAILHDQRSILTLCTSAAKVQRVRDITISLPRLIGRRGVRQTCCLMPMTWLQRYRVRHFVANSIWIFPSFSRTP